MSVSCPECGKEVKGASQLVVHRKSHGIRQESLRDIAGAAAQPAESPFDQSTATDPLGGGEPTAPEEPKKSWRERLRPGEQTPKGPERRPTPPRPRRVDASGMLGEFWAWMGRKVEETYSLPTGRALQMEADAAGTIIADQARDTLADRPIQWAARHYEAGSVLIDLFMFPGLVEYAARNPDQIPTVAPRIIECAVNLGPAAAKAAKKRAKKMADFAEAMEGMRDIWGVPDGQPVTPEHLLHWLFPPDPQGTIPAVSRIA